MEKISKKQLIYNIKTYGDFMDSYPVDESQVVSNAGNAEIYLYKSDAGNAQFYEIITWNEMAVDHTPGSITLHLLESLE